MKVKLLTFLVAVSLCLFVFSCKEVDPYFHELGSYAMIINPYLDDAAEVIFDKESGELTLFSKENSKLCQCILEPQLRKEVIRVYLSNHQLFVVTFAWIDDERGYVFFNDVINIDGIYQLDRVTSNVWKYTNYP